MPSCMTVTKPTRDVVAWSRSHSLQSKNQKQFIQSKNNTKQINNLQIKIEQLERQLQECEFERQANMVYNRQFRQLGRMLGDESMEYEQLRGKIEDMILQGSIDVGQYSKSRIVLKDNCQFVLNNCHNNDEDNNNKQIQALSMTLLREELMQLRHELLNQRKMKQMVKKQLTEYQQIQTILNKQIADLRIEILSTKQELKIKQQRLDEIRLIKDDNEMLRNKMGEYQKLAQQNQLIIQQKDSVINQYNMRINSYDNLIIANQTAIANYEVRISGYENKIHNYVGKIDDYESKCSEYESRISDYENKISGYESKISNCQSKLYTLAQQLTTYINEISTYEKSIATYTEQLDQKQLMINQLQQSLATTHQQHQQAIKALESTLQVTRQQLQRIRFKLVQTQRQLALVQNNKLSFHQGQLERNQEQIGQKQSLIEQRSSNVKNTIDDNDNDDEVNSNVTRNEQINKQIRMRESPSLNRVNITYGGLQSKVIYMSNNTMVRNSSIVVSRDKVQSQPQQQNIAISPLRQQQRTIYQQQQHRRPLPICSNKQIIEGERLVRYTQKRQDIRNVLSNQHLVIKNVIKERQSPIRLVSAIEKQSQVYTTKGDDYNNITFRSSSRSISKDKKEYLFSTAKSPTKNIYPSPRLITSPVQQQVISYHPNKATLGYSQVGKFNTVKQRKNIRFAEQQPYYNIVQQQQQHTVFEKYRPISFGQQTPHAFQSNKIGPLTQLMQKTNNNPFTCNYDTKMNDSQDSGFEVIQNSDYNGLNCCRGG